MTRVNPDLRQYVETHILPQYAAYDKAHNVAHIKAVMEESLRIASFYPVEVDMVYVIAAYHDVGVSEGREQHHLSSGRIMAQDATLHRWFSPAQLVVMREAVEDHRASNAHEPRSIYGKIVAEADRQILPLKTLQRIVDYEVDDVQKRAAQADAVQEQAYQRAPVAAARIKEEVLQRCCLHLDEKYAEGGYMKLWIPESENAKGLAQLRAIIHDKPRLMALLSGYYDALQPPSAD